MARLDDAYFACVFIPHILIRQEQHDIIFELIKIAKDDDSCAVCLHFGHKISHVGDDDRLAGGKGVGERARFSALIVSPNNDVYSIFGREISVAINDP